MASGCAHDKGLTTHTHAHVRELMSLLQEPEKLLLKETSVTVTAVDAVEPLLLMAPRLTKMLPPPPPETKPTVQQGLAQPERKKRM